MKVALLCKRHYTSKDLLADRFGRLYHLPVQLAGRGARVSVTAVDYRGSSPEAMTANGVEFATVPARRLRLPGAMRRAFVRIVEQKPDVVVGSGDIHLGHAALLAARRLGRPFVFDVYDYYPAFSLNRLPGMKRMFRGAVRDAALVLCASESLQRAVKPLNPRTLHVPNGVDRTLFRPMPIADARRALGLDPRVPVVGYFGSINPERGPLLVEACGMLREQLPQVRALMAGRNLGVDLDRPWVDYRGELPQERVPQLIAACDVVTLPYAVDEQIALSAACKIAEYLACERPVVGTRIPDHESIFRGAPQTLCEADAPDMARAIRSQLEAPQLAPFPSSLEWSAIGRELHAALSELARGGSRGS